MSDRDSWGIKFSEHMGGYFCENVDDPIEGFGFGKSEGHPIDFWVKIHITPLRKFFENREHTAEMTGKFSAGPFGKDLPLQNGEFNIYAGDRSGLKYITYKFGFTSADSKPYYFSGIKNIHTRKNERKRNENVTLHSRIHEGSSEDGKVVGAGILRFDLLKDGPGLFSTIRVTGASSFGEKLKAMRMFAVYSGA